MGKVICKWWLIFIGISGFRVMFGFGPKSIAQGEVVKIHLAQPCPSVASLICWKDLVMKLSSIYVLKQNSICFCKPRKRMLDIYVFQVTDMCLVFNWNKSIKNHCSQRKSIPYFLPITFFISYGKISYFVFHTERFPARK